MKQFTVNEYGKDTWMMQDFGPIVRCGASKSPIDYSEHTHYFHELFEVIGEFIDDIDLSLNITNKACNMTLYLKDNQMSLVEDIAFALEDAFPDNIESVYVLGNELSFEDALFEFYPSNSLPISEEIEADADYNNWLTQLSAVPALLMAVDVMEAARAEKTNIIRCLRDMKENIMNSSNK